MAVKNTEKPKRSSLLETLANEYKISDIILAVLALIICAFSAMLLKGETTISPDVPIIGTHPKIFAWVIMAIGVVSLLFVVIPFYKPALPELKKMDWPTKNKFLGNIARVLIVMLVLCVCFVIYDYFLVMFFEAVC